MAIDPDIKEELKNILEEKNIAKKQLAMVVSSYKLSDAELDNIKKSFPILKKYFLFNRVDNKIQAGFIIKFDSKVVDLTLRSQLNNFKKITYEVDR